MKIDKWLNVEFESSTTKTEQFKTFAREYKACIKKLTSNQFELVGFSVGHFYISGFLKNKDNDKLVYFSCSDVRFFVNGWHDFMLIRTAEHDKDWTGGNNHNVSLERLNEKAEQLTK